MRELQTKESGESKVNSRSRVMGSDPYWVGPRQMIGSAARGKEGTCIVQDLQAFGRGGAS